MKKFETRVQRSEVKLDLSRKVLSFLNSTPNKFECEVQSAKTRLLTLGKNDVQSAKTRLLTLGKNDV